MMEVIFGGRRTGRTTKLIQMAAEAGAKGEVCYIVCMSNNEAYRIKQRANEMGLFIGFPITYDEFRQGQIASQNVKFLLIDNAECLLQRLIGIPIKAITIEDEDATAKRLDT